MLLLMYWLQNFSFKLRIGNGNLASNDHDDHVEIREILNVTIHPAFDGGSTLYYDLAVVKTQPLEIGTVKYFPKKYTDACLSTGHLFELFWSPTMLPVGMDHNIQFWRMTGKFSEKGFHVRKTQFGKLGVLQKTKLKVTQKL